MEESADRSGGREFFGRLNLLVGEKAAAAYSALKVTVVGVGGVGGWCAEALARSGVGRITLVDGDRVAASNINRQLVATSKSIGQPKVDVLAGRLRDINPSAAITPLFMRYTPETADSFRLEDVDWVVDAIDSVPDKAHLVNAVTRMERPRLVSSMGAASRTDPTRVIASDFGKVTGDGLARALRQRFRKSGEWPAKKFTAVWSSEQRRPNLGRPDPAEPRANGTLMPVTASFGLVLASVILNATLKENMV
ncbi:MAG: ThiF family adenylyltransferase [Kiritimatiellae bacterium]|nr:ThiF family adenylyltransferase [Kiritimatiellia bacterium]